MMMNRPHESSAGTESQSRILVIRGGAIGDFVLTLPALGLLRNAFPTAWIELLGYPHIASLADRRFYVNRVRSIEYGPLAGFFAKNAELNPELSEYFRSFQQVVSFLFDNGIGFNVDNQNVDIEIDLSQMKARVEVWKGR